MNTENRKISFHEWLSQQAYRKDNIGSFARMMIAEEKIPSSSNLLDWYRFINDTKKVSVFEFIQVWGEYAGWLGIGGNG